MKDEILKVLEAMGKEFHRGKFPYEEIWLAKADIEALPEDKAWVPLISLIRSLARDNYRLDEHLRNIQRAAARYGPEI